LSIRGNAKSFLVAMAKIITLEDYYTEQEPVPGEEEEAQQEQEQIEKPFVFINAAMSADGKIATIQRTQTRISGIKDFDRVDALRAESDALMVGVGTVLADDPSLTVKSQKRRERRKRAGMDENPLRIVVDSKARTPSDAEVLNKGEGRRIVAVSEQAIVVDIGRLGEKAEVLVCGQGEVDLKRLLHDLALRGVRKVMVEGGARLNWSLLSQRLVDEIYTFVGNVVIGGDSAPTLVDGRGFDTPEALLKLQLIRTEKLDEGILLRWRVVNEAPKECENDHETA